MSTTRRRRPRRRPRRRQQRQAMLPRCLLCNRPQRQRTRTQTRSRGGSLWCVRERENKSVGLSAHPHTQLPTHPTHPSPHPLVRAWLNHASPPRWCPRLCTRCSSRCSTGRTRLSRCTSTAGRTTAPSPPSGRTSWARCVCRCAAGGRRRGRHTSRPPMQTYPFRAVTCFSSLFYYAFIPGAQVA